MQNIKKLLSSPAPLALLGLLIALSLSLITIVPLRDVATRYAPMADAFAAGNWSNAFHPRVPPLLPVLAGVVALLTGCGGFLATKLVGCTFFALAVFPLYGIFKRVFNSNTAWLSCLLYVFSSHLLRIASSGLRESVKSFAFILAIYGLLRLFQERRSLPGYLWLGLGSALLILCRVDGLLFALLIGLSAFFLELREGNSFQTPWRSMLAGLLVMALIAPTLAYNLSRIGYPVPEGRFAVIISKVESRLSGRQETITRNRQAPAVAAPEVLICQHEGHPASRTAVLIDFLGGVFKGFYPYFFLPALPVIAWRLARRKMSVEEKILLAALLGHTALLILQIGVYDQYLYVSRRYLLPAAPLAFGWTAMAVLLCNEWLRSKLKSKTYGLLAIALPSLIGALLLLDATAPILKVQLSEKKRLQQEALFKCAAWIKSDYKQSKREVHIRAFDPNSYLSDQRPYIYEGALSGMAYIAGGTSIAPELLDECLSGKELDYLVVKGQNSLEATKVKGYRPCHQEKAGAAEYYIFKPAMESPQ